MILTKIIIILIAFIFIYIKFTLPSKNIESFSENNKTSTKTGYSESSISSDLIENKKRDILTILDNNLPNFKISGQQYQRIKNDINFFFKYHKSTFNNKVSDKNFMYYSLENKIIPLSYKKKINLYCFVYLFLNQDMISKRQLYENYQYQFGYFLYFINPDEYINKNTIIYQTIPYDYSKIINIKDIIYLYESLRNEGIISFVSIFRLKEHYHLYLKKKKTLSKEELRIL